MAFNFFRKTPTQAPSGADTIFDRYAVTAKEREFIELALGVPIHKFTDYTSYLSTGYKKVWATARSCRLIEARVRSAKFEMRLNDKPAGGYSRGFAEGGFLAKPNPYDTWSGIIGMLVWHLELVGNGYWLKDERDLLGRPTALYPLLPQNMKLTPDKKTKVSVYEYSVNGRVVKYKPEEIIHFRSTHPNSLLFGMGSVESAESLYNSAINKDAVEENFMKNGAMVSGILTREDAVEDETQWVALKQKWNKEYAGKHNAGKTAFLNGKWAYHKLGMTMAEMQALERERLTVEQIFINHGVPLSVAGIKNAANYATARQDEINFGRYKCVPVLDSIVDTLNADGFIQSIRSGLKLVYELSGLIDLEQIISEYSKLVDIGAMTRNEMREKAGLPRGNDPFLDKYTVTQGTMLLEHAGIPPQKGGNPAGVAPKPDKPSKPDAPDQPDDADSD